MNFTVNTKELILIHKQMKQVTSQGTIDVMLTPQFYTIKREEIPVRYAYQAKKVASSLFDGLLDKQGEYEYFIQKEKETWLFIAYNLNEIKDFIFSKGINLDQVSKMYFVEQSVKMFTKPVLLGEKEALVALDGSIVVVPQTALIEEKTTSIIDKQFIPEKGVSLGNSNSLFSLNQSLILSTVFVLFSLIFLLEGLRYTGGNNEIEKQMELLLENYPSLKSKYTRQSVAKKYQKIDAQEHKKRDIIKTLSKMIFKGSELISLYIDEKKFQAKFTCKDANIIKKVKELAKKEQFNTVTVSDKHELRVEGIL